MNFRFVPAWRSSRLVRAAVVAAVLAAGTVAGSVPTPDPTPGTGSTPGSTGGTGHEAPAEATSRATTARAGSVTRFLGWDTTGRHRAGEPVRDGVLVSPARGREVALQQQVDGSWVTRSTLTLDDVAADVVLVDLTRHWRREPETRWRLRAAATATVPAATSAVRTVQVVWEPSDDPADPAVLVTKDRPVRPAGFEPRRLTTPDVTVQGSHVQLVPPAARALERLAEDASQATGRRLVLVSGFRSAAYQESLFDRYAARHGASGADRFSARSGHSEHQTGWAADVTEAGVEMTRFGGTPSADWVDENAWRYGYVVRYPVGGRDVTGYDPEPWHLRYVGEDLAAYVHRTGGTLEAAFGVG